MKLDLKETIPIATGKSHELTSSSSLSSSSPALPSDKTQTSLENNLNNNSNPSQNSLMENISNHVNEKTSHSTHHHNHNHHHHHQHHNNNNNNNKNNHNHLNGDSTHHHHDHNHNHNEEESNYEELKTSTTTSSNSLIITSIIKSSTLVSNATSASTTDNIELEHLDEFTSSTTTTNALGNSPISEPINKRPRLSNT